jgi:hypothetical protein
MVLSEVIAGLDRELAKNIGYKIVVLSRQRDQSTSGWGDVEAVAVIDVVLDEHDSHVDILTNDGAEESADVGTSLDADELLCRLRLLETRCGDWSVYVGSSPQPLSTRFSLRFDFPVVGLGTNHEDRTVALLQYPEEQWSHAV